MLPVLQTVIKGMDCTPHIGSFILLDSRHLGELLQAGDDPIGQGYPGCQFRMPVRNSHFGPVSVNVKVTGRTVQIKQGMLMVRVQIEWVGDCEPSQFSSGWMKVNNTH